jgi:hypothetical protein
VKRRSGGGVRFSRDPMNLMNKHSRKARISLSRPRLTNRANWRLV